MRAIVLRAALSTLFAWAAFGQASSGQTQERVFHFTNANAPVFQQIVNVIRVMGEIPQASADLTAKTLTVQGTGDQIALATWLFNELDKPASGPRSPDPAPFDYNGTTRPDRVVRIFYVNPEMTPVQEQEIVNTVRTIPELVRVIQLTGPNAIVVRGEPGQVAMGEWLIGQLDPPAGKQTIAQSLTPVTSPYPSGGSENVVRIFTFPQEMTPAALQEVVNAVRTIVEITRALPNVADRALVVRGTPGDIALAAWLVSGLTQPTAQPGQGAPTAYQTSGPNGSVLRVFHLTNSPAPQSIQDLSSRIRSSTQMTRVWPSISMQALAVRGTPGQVALAERLIQGAPGQ